AAAASAARYPRAKLASRDDGGGLTERGCRGRCERRAADGGGVLEKLSPGESGHFTANTQTAPPSGTSGYFPGIRLFNCVCMPEESPPIPERTAPYCLPSSTSVAGWPITPELVGYSQSSVPVDASSAWNLRSFVPPVNTSPPPVASIGPQFCEFAYACVH